ncbi:MAG: hypothetical protein QOD56_2993, partial [Gammaproteobacteria bacterium]|nr:hypothetical protein [Gammaproteobacteria bacterium]
MDRREASTSAPVAPNISLLTNGAVAFAAIFTAGFAGLALPMWGARFPLPLLHAGIAAAVIYRWGRRMWVPVLAAGVLFELAAKEPLIGALGVGVGLTAGSLLSAWLLRKYEFDPNFGRARDVPVFLFAVVLGMSVSPTLGVLGFALAGVPTDGSNFVRWIRWWSNTTVSVLLVGPAVIGLSRQSLRRFHEH